jgi:hypothetical protein
MKFDQSERRIDEIFGGNKRNSLGKNLLGFGEE